MKYFCDFWGQKYNPISIKKISLRGTHLPCGAPLRGRWLTRAAPPKKTKKLAAARGHSRIPLLNKRHPRLGPSRSRGSLPEWTVDRVFFRKASHPLKKSSLTRVPTPHHPEPGKHSPQIPAGLCGCICRSNYKHKQKIECFLFSAGAETKSNALCWS